MVGAIAAAPACAGETVTHCSYGQQSWIFLHADEKCGTPPSYCGKNQDVDACAGKAAFAEYQSARVRTIAEVLTRLSDDDRADVGRLIAKLHDVLAGRFSA